MKAGGGIIDDAVVAVADELDPTPAVRAWSYTGLGTRWVWPIRLDLFDESVPPWPIGLREPNPAGVRLQAGYHGRLPLGIADYNESCLSTRVFM